MNSTTEPFTFRPPVRRKGTRIALGMFLSLLALGGGAVGIVALWMPRSLEYSVQSGELIVTTGFSVHPTVVAAPLVDIQKIRPVTLQRGSRVSGTSLPGYCAGAFRFPDLGRVRLATDCSREAVVLTVRGWKHPWVLSPGDRQSFLASCSGNGTYSEAFKAGTRGTGWTAMKTMVLIALLPCLLVPYLFFIPPSRLKYRVVPGFLEIDTALGTKRFSIGNCIARSYDPESSSKVIGSSMPGFYSGRFSLDGMATRVYATHMEAGVLVEGPDLRLFVTPQEPNAFLECLRARGGMPVE